ncbi:MAG: class III signal peptide-containing protein [Candidatus Omnitrophica bacterium]|nr:class III signal peptide-containing protein [Candidatus Omnitrophota bacterium]
MLKRDIMLKPQKKKKGQSTVEYIILVAAIIGALIIFLPGTFRTAFNAALQSGTNGMENMATRLSTSRPLAP